MADVAGESYFVVKDPSSSNIYVLVESGNEDNREVKIQNVSQLDHDYICQEVRINTDSQSHCTSLGEATHVNDANNSCETNVTPLYDSINSFYTSAIPVDDTLNDCETSAIEDDIINSCLTSDTRLDYYNANSWETTAIIVDETINGASPKENVNTEPILPSPKTATSGLQCSICGATFTGKFSYEKHCLRHELAKPRNCVECRNAIEQCALLRGQSRCEHCHRAFTISSKVMLKLRGLNTLTQKKFHCDLCSKSFSAAHRLKTHMRVHTGERPFQCEYCDATFSRKDNIDQHYRAHIKGKLSVKTKDCEGLSESAVAMQLEAGKDVFRCAKCVSVFAEEGDLQLHKLCHAVEKRFQCADCPKTFTQKHGFMVHRRMHAYEKANKREDKNVGLSVEVTALRVAAGEKVFRCNRCTLVFADETHLQSHSVCHAPVKRYKCDQCPKAFTQKSTLTVHYRNHTNEKPYKCEECDAAFSQKYQLRVHAFKHSGEMPFKCNFCDETFAQKESLKLHIRKHTGERHYKCPDCVSTFSHANSLRKHRRIHGPESENRPFKCNLCDGGFLRKRNLVLHMRVHATAGVDVAWEDQE